MTWFKKRKPSKPDDHKPSKIAEVKLTQAHRLTLRFIVELLEVLRQSQPDFHVNDVLTLHLGHLTDLYIHVVEHLKHQGNVPDDKQQPKS